MVTTEPTSKKGSTARRLVPKDLIIRYHGLFVAHGAYICHSLRRFSLRSQWDRNRDEQNESEYDSKRRKSTARFQDTVVIKIFILALLVTIIGHVSYSYSYSLCFAVITWVLSSFALYTLLDIILYHIEVLWFYDFVANRDPRVWSHRRILSEAGLNFVESVGLFSLLHRVPHASMSLKDALFVSISSATLNAPEHLTEKYVSLHWSSLIIWSFQIGVSLLFLAGVFAVLVSVAYRRGEIAADEGTCSMCRLLRTEDALVSVEIRGVACKVCKQCIQTVVNVSVNQQAAP